MNKIRSVTLMMVLWSGVALSQIIVPQSRFDANAGYWYVKDDSPWTFNYPARNSETNSLVWITSETNNITTAPLVSVTVRQPVGGGYNNPTYTNLPGKAVARLTPGGGYLAFQFPDLPPGVRHIRVYGFATNAIVECVAHSGWVSGVPPDRRSVRRPLELQWEINDGPAGETNCYRMLGFYCSSNQLWEIQRFYVVGRAATNQLYGRLSVSTNSLVTLDVAQLEFVEELNFADTNLWKTAPTTYTADERTARIASTSGLTNEPFTSWKNNLPSFSTPTVQSVWDAMYGIWPSFHTMYGENPFLAGSPSFAISPRSTGNIAYGDWRYGLKFTNSAGTVLTPTNWWKGTVPGYGGYYFDPATTNWTYGVGVHFGQGNVCAASRMHGLLGQAGYEQYSPFKRWHYFPSATNAVHHGLAALANYMAMYPSINYERGIHEFIDNESPGYGYKYSSQTSRRKGRQEYDGWQGQSAESIVNCIDYSWDYLKTSTTFAQDLTREWPFINNSTNQVMVFFNRVLDLMVRDYDATIARGNPWTLGLVKQSGADSERLMDASVTPISVVPDGGGGVKYQYASSFSQQGVHYIGSLYYAFAGSLSDAYKTFKYYELGGSQAAYDLADMSLYPKIASWADLLATLPVANGYLPDFGDAGLRNWQGPAMHGANWQTAWRMLEDTGSTNRYRMAKYLVNVAGRGELSDAEWATVTNEAAQTAFDIRRATESRVQPGFGLAVLETGIGSTNDMERAAVVLKTGVGYGHDHSDHLDFNYYALKARLLPDFATRYEGSMLMYPYSYVQDVHNVVSVGGWDDPRTLDTEGSSSGNWLFSDSGSAQVMGAEMWPKAGLPITHKSRMVAMVRSGANSYAVDVQRVVATTNHVTWNFGTTHMGVGTNDFLCNVPLAALPGTGSSNSLTFKFRKHAFTGIYWPAANTNTGYGTLEFKWKLSNTSGSRGNIVNLDGNGGTVAVYNASANMGAATNTYLSAKLFDRTNDYVVAADAFSSYYGFLTRRAYVLPRPGGPNVDTTHLALTVPFAGTNFVSSSTSLVVSGQADDASATKALQVQASGYTDLHLLGPDTTTRVVQVAGQCFDGAYGFVRSDSTGAVVEVKLVGGGCLSNSTYGLVLSSRFVGGTITQPNYTANTFVASSWTGVKKKGWYRFHNSTHHAENYVTGFNGNTVTWRGDALIGTVDVADGYTSGNTITTDDGSLPVLDYPMRRTGMTAMNEAGTKLFQVNASGSTNLTRIAGDTVTGSDFTDLDNDGWEEARLYDFGPGDAVEVPSEACLIVNPAGGWALSANASVTVTVCGNDGEALYLDGVEQTTTYDNGRLTAVLAESSLTGYGQALTVGVSSQSLQSGETTTAMVTDAKLQTTSEPSGTEPNAAAGPLPDAWAGFLSQAISAADAGEGLILGTVRGGGLPVPDASVYGLSLTLDASGNVIHWKQETLVKTDLAGRYLLALSTGGVYAVAAEGAEWTPWLCEGYHKVVDVADAVRFIPDIAAPVTGIDFDLIEGGLIGGTVRNAKTKLPLPGIQIQASQGAQQGAIFYGVSASNGTYRIHVPAGAGYTIKAMGTGWITQSYTGRLTAVSGSLSTNINFSMKVAR